MVSLSRPKQLHSCFQRYPSSTQSTIVFLLFSKEEEVMNKLDAMQDDRVDTKQKMIPAVVAAQAAMEGTAFRRSLLTNFLDQKNVSMFTRDKSPEFYHVDKPLNTASTPSGAAPVPSFFCWTWIRITGGPQ
eukprot:scaffold1827_cov167-Amphora_coffeaeformis.AAC.9